MKLVFSVNKVSYFLHIQCKPAIKYFNTAQATAHCLRRILGINKKYLQEQVFQLVDCCGTII